MLIAGKEVCRGKNVAVFLVHVGEVLFVVSLKHKCIGRECEDSDNLIPDFGAIWRKVFVFRAKLDFVMKKLVKAFRSARKVFQIIEIVPLQSGYVKFRIREWGFFHHC